jgi:hypothetical protein
MWIVSVWVVPAIVDPCDRVDIGGCPVATVLTAGLLPMPDKVLAGVLFGAGGKL